VVRFDPFHLTTDAVVKPAPFTVNVKAPEPAYADAGDKDEMTGGGLRLLSTETG
jgi:hypothetical protein